MGVMYIPLLLNEETKQWLREEGVAFLSTEMPSRWPTPNELRAVLDSLVGYSVSYRTNSDGGWDVEIVDAELGYNGWFATIWTKNTTDKDKPNEFSFHKPNPEMALMILEKLSHVCGHFVLIQDSSMIPVIVAPGSDVIELTAQYG
jgi:hypothetical protein